MAVQSTLAAAIDGDRRRFSSAVAPLAHRLRQPGTPRNAAAVVAIVVALLVTRLRSHPLLAPLLAKRGHASGLHAPRATDDQLAQALEQLYIPHQDGTRTLLVPYHQRIGHVRIAPTKPTVIDTNAHYFQSMGVLDQGTAAQANAKAAKGEKQPNAAALESQIIRKQGGAANAGARKVGVNRAFFQQLRYVPLSCLSAYWSLSTGDLSRTACGPAAIRKTDDVPWCTTVPSFES